ncbi:hypothetical protein [Pseudarthrobacter sp. NamB4]|uniref:hypothetical protein n=1 Tax=Pseudarthrobacter sp. NamB4 TaxID=2576837 RepID=UPI0010FF567F|nr:hypothetical protein [Pseudarthrobacter sp. NamB4]TLM72263.1 hypothetical protein FDW81_14270 [Pseudarthrobacter sp. NamB4]
MRTRKLLAAGSAATLIAGGVFLSAAPASADNSSTDCLSAQGAFTAALNNVELNAGLKVELAVALQNLVDAQETLELLRVNGTPTRADIEAQIATELEDTRLKVPQLPAIQALINANAKADSAVGQARALIDAADDGPLDQATLEALAAAGVKPELFLLAPLLEAAELEAAVNAAVGAELPVGLSQGLVDALLLDINNGDDVLSVASVTTLAALGIEVKDFETRQFDVAAIGVELDGVVTVEEQEAALAVLAALNAGDIAAILEADTALEVLTGENLDFTALVNLQTQLLKAQAILDAQADLGAAVAAVNGLRVQLDALDIDVLDLKALFTTAIEACDGGSAIGGGLDNDGNGGASGGAGSTDGAATGGANGAAGGTATAALASTGGAATTAAGANGTNRGMNIQTAGTAATTDPAGIGAFLAGIGFMVAAAGTLATRRIRTS